MEVALVGFVGAGIALWYSGVDENVPSEAHLDGVELIRRLANSGDRVAVETVVAEIAREIWQEWQTSRRSVDDIARHLEALPAILERHRPPASLVTGAIAEAGKIRRRGGSIELMAHRLVSEIVPRARDKGDLAASDLDETLCFFLLTRQIASTLTRSDRLLAQRHALAAAVGRVSPTHDAGLATTDPVPSIAAAPEPDCPSDAASLPAGSDTNFAPEPLVVETAETFALPVGLLQAAVAALPGFLSKPITVQGIETQAALCVELLAEIDAAATECSRGPAGDTLASARTALAHGSFDRADALLAEGEAAAQATAGEGRTPSPDDQGNPLVWRILRGRLAEVASDWRSAARHYSFAATRTSPGMRHERGPLLVRQAAALVACGMCHDEESALIEAAQIYAEAGGYLSEQSSPLEWAEAHVDLGKLMLMLGDRESRPERFLAAVLHFKPAVDVYLRLQAMDDWARAQVGLATGLKRTGEFQGDVVMLGDAAFAFRAALGVLTKDRAPGEWADAQLALGETLVRIAEETGDRDALDDAIRALRSALAQPVELAPDLDRVAVEASLGRAYASLGVETQDETMLQEAISLLESALASGASALSVAERAAMELVRGTALWSLGEARANERLLADAARAKIAALGHYETLGNGSAVFRIREDLEDLEAAIGQLARRTRGGAAAATERMALAGVPGRAAAPATR